MSFTNTQIRKLRARVKPNIVKAREVEGKRCTTEGWHLISEANRYLASIVGTARPFQLNVYGKKQIDHRFAAAYMTRVKISVRGWRQHYYPDVAVPVKRRLPHPDKLTNGRP